MGEEQKSLPVFPETIYEPTHGVHRWKLGSNQVITGLSAQTWEAFVDQLNQLTAQDRIIVSPELMTFPDQSLEKVNKARNLIDDRVQQVLGVSREYPEALFLLGTPTFPPKGKPRNSVIYLKNGEIIGGTNKRFEATEVERACFDLHAEAKKALVPGTDIGLLICRDLAYASLIHPQARTLLVSSCWGLGGRKQGIMAHGPDRYYQLQLRNVVHGIFMSNNELKEVIVVDRIPFVGEELQPFTPTKPFNALLRRP